MQHTYPLFPLRLLILSLGLQLPLCAHAQIKTDGSVGPTAQTLIGPQYTIPQSLGQLAGSNLFHSFQTFNINTGESANFTTSTAGIANVISRVTGGSASNINGTLSLTPASGTPAFFFINPAGVTFGKGATVDVPGALHVSTASYLKFPDGAWYTDLQKTSTLSSAAPQAFGFLGTMQRALLISDGAEIGVKTGQPISLVAGDIAISNGAYVRTNGGDARVVAIGQTAQTVPLAGGLAAASGDMQITSGGQIYAPSGNGVDAGNITLSAGNITMDGQGSAELTGIASSAEKAGSGKAGSITVTAAQDLKVLNGAAIFSDTNATGAAGTIRIHANNITVDGQKMASLISSSANPGSSGKAGNVELTAQSLSVTNGGHVFSDTFATGDAGTVRISANDVTLDGQGVVTLISSTAGSSSSGKAGNVEVVARRNLLVRNGGVIDSSTFATGDAGTVKISAASITLDGQGNDAGISSSAFPGSGGKAGSVEVVATQDLKVLNAGAIFSTTSAQGDAGTVRISAGDITMDGMGHFAAISSGAFTDSSGQTGNVDVSATRSITLRNSAAIDIGNRATIGTPEKIIPTHITVTAPRITLKDIAIIAAHSSGNIAASNITVNTDKLLLDTSRIVTNANQGNGGAITVHGSGVLLNNARITTSVAGSSGNGGDIAVHATALALNTGFIQANTAANKAKGGDVTIDVQALAPSAGNSLFLGGNTPYTFQSGQFGYNVIQAAAPTGLNGEIHTTALAIDISGALAGLGAPALDAGGMGRNPCRLGGGSSFAKSGRGGFAPSARRALVPLLAVSGETASALPAALDQQLVSAPLDCGKS